MTAVGQDRLPEIPLLAPSAGLIVEFLHRWYGPNFTTRLRIVAEVDSIYYSLALLRSQLVHGVLICARAAADAAVQDADPAAQGCVWSPYPTTTTRRCSYWPGSSPAKASDNGMTTPIPSTCSGTPSPPIPSTDQRDGDCYERRRRPSWTRQPESSRFPSHSPSFAGVRQLPRGCSGASHGRCRPETDTAPES
jgi:hypothetical protein